MSREADMVAVAEAIAEILLQEGLIDLRGSEANIQVAKVFADLLQPVSEFVETEFVRDEADACPADGSAPIEYDGSVEGLMKLLP